MSQKTGYTPYILGVVFMSGVFVFHDRAIEFLGLMHNYRRQILIELDCMIVSAVCFFGVMFKICHFFVFAPSDQCSKKK